MMCLWCPCVPHFEPAEKKQAELVVGAATATDSLLVADAAPAASHAPCTATLVVANDDGTA